MKVIKIFQYNFLYQVRKKVKKLGSQSLDELYSLIVFFLNPNKRKNIKFISRHDGT